MRHVEAVTLRQLGFSGKDVAAVLGLTTSYVATLRQRALREGTAALVRKEGRQRETDDASWEQARAWRAEGARDAEIARRLGVNQSTVLRRLGRAHVQDPLPQAPRRNRRPLTRRPRSRRSSPVPESPCRAASGGRGAARRRAGDGPVPVRRGDAAARVRDAGRSRGDPAGRAGENARRGDVALLSAVSLCFALGAATTEQFKHLAAAEAGPLAACTGSRICGRCGPGWPRSPTAPTAAAAAHVRRRDAGRRPGPVRGVLRR